MGHDLPVLPDATWLGANGVVERSPFEFLDRVLGPGEKGDGHEWHCRAETSAWIGLGLPERIFYYSVHELVDL
jgi:hypothetical protein